MAKKEKLSYYQVIFYKDENELLLKRLQSYVEFSGITMRQLFLKSLDEYLKNKGF